MLIFVQFQFTRIQGLYGGLGLDGKVISVRPKCNEEFYGTKSTVKNILNKVDPLTIQNEDYCRIVNLLNTYCAEDEDEKKNDDIADSINRMTKLREPPN